MLFPCIFLHVLFCPWGYVRKVYATYIYGEGLLYKAGLQITNPIIHTGLFTYLRSGKCGATVNVIFMCFSFSPGGTALWQVLFITWILLFSLVLQ